MKKIVLLIISFVFLISCSLESEFSLKNNENVKDKLLGVWKVDGKDALEFKKKSAKVYDVYFIEGNKKERLTLFTSTIKGVKYFNLTDSKMNTFYKYEFKDGKLYVYGITKKYRNTKFKSQKELLKFLKKNGKKDDFFDVKSTDLIFNR